MEISSETVEPRQVQLTIVVSPERIAQAMNEVAQQFARHQRIPGYRPGKVPLARVLAAVGEDAVRKAALDGLAEKVAREAIKAEGLVPAGATSIEVTAEDPFTVRALVPLAPTVDLGDYRALRVPRAPKPEVDEAAVDQTIERWVHDLATLQHVDRPAEDGDTVTVHLVGRLADSTGAEGALEKVVFEDEALTLALTAEGAVEAMVPPAVVHEVVGMSAGERRTFTARYSELWTQPELQGRDVTFEATVSDVLALHAPELDDAMARELAGVDTVPALRERVRAQIQVRGLMQAADDHVNAAVDAIVGASVVAYPPGLLDAEVAALIADLRWRVERQGFTWERWLELQGKDEEALWAEAQPEAQRRLERRLVMAEFVRAEAIDISPADVDAEVKRLTASWSGAARRGMPSRDEMRRSTGSRLLSNRALDRLIEIVTPAPAEAADPDAVAPDAVAPEAVAPEAAADEAVAARTDRPNAPVVAD